MTRQAFITNQISEQVPVGDAILATVSKGVATVVNTGEARWFLAFDTDGLINAKRITPQVIEAGGTVDLKFLDPVNI